jgi:hypothetical protein
MWHCYKTKSEMFKYKNLVFVLSILSNEDNSNISTVSHYFMTDITYFVFQHTVLGNARNQGNCLKYLENCQNSRVTKLGLGVNKKFLLQLLGQTICQTFSFKFILQKWDSIS